MFKQIIYFANFACTFCVSEGGQHQTDQQYAKKSVVVRFRGRSFPFSAKRKTKMKFYFIVVCTIYQLFEEVIKRLTFAGKRSGAAEREAKNLHRIITSLLFIFFVLIDILFTRFQQNHSARSTFPETNQYS